ncbi:hypothetical protein [Microbulbifer sp. THAF38]|uniref:hypothetical protein n=1 Tax=Microbulbifer sp. THAF38 TaxID=2587856 RepID=UPI0012694C55|nr:hypothetical protein [Microbulbifer sp. THAF38]QFT54589.1 hypothetical protein FIU95_08495 [Microbulbifer sp. THAF38]
MEAIASIIDSLVWPVCIVIIVLVLKSEISHLAKKVSRISHKETQIDFNAAVKNASFSLETEELNTKITVSDELSDLSPRGSVIESWLRVEDAVRGYNLRHGIDASKEKPFRSSLAAMNSIHYDSIGKGTLQMLESLRRLRNEAVHLSDANISAVSAKEYRVMADKVISALEMA